MNDWLRVSETAVQDKEKERKRNKREKEQEKIFSPASFLFGVFFWLRAGPKNKHYFSLHQRASNPRYCLQLLDLGLLVLVISDKTLNLVLPISVAEMMSQDGLSVPSTIPTGFAQPQEPNYPNPNPNPTSTTSNPAKKKRNLPGTPDPDAEVIALSPKSLMATNRFICEICNKGFQRDQNLQLHRRGHNLPWKLKQRTNKEVRKKVYICPEKTCVHHDRSRALGDLTGIKKHYSRKHGEKKWKCEKCSKKYAVQSDWKAHSKICGTREYRCDCGTLFSRKDSFITHRAFCDALAEESARFTTVSSAIINPQVAVGMNHLSSILTADFTGPDQFAGNLIGDGQKLRLPVWLDQGNSSQLNPIGNIASSSNANFLAPNSTNGLADLGIAPINNMFGSVSYKYPEASFTGANNLSISTLAPLPRGMPKEEREEDKGNLSQSITCLYSNNNNNRSSQGHMSATALLQKAAQMGSARSNPSANNGPSSTSGFGLMTSSLSSIFRQPNNNLNELANRSQPSHQVQLVSSARSPYSERTSSQQQNQAENLNELVSSLSSSSHGSLLGELSSSSFMNMNKKSTQGSVEGGLTRDFLGVGGESSRPFLQQELAKFASMESATAMELSQYGLHGHHC
ncbi:hypothetical protein SLEP1_g7170 [Rubroshorea leprosula]|uniref:C2H2-type domain-containing protein n=1 Tax=Rubroshorea leprosula TaxID=152421 RepID=A0AAV5HXU8_9ROSI|nr:hypothetical protein SLEP1_g7170 [Rubroshorea leprosula]